MKKQNHDKKNKLPFAGFVILMVAVLASCASTGKMSLFQMNDLLARAGFQLHNADTPKKLDFLKSLPQNKLLHKSYNGKMFYFYADDSSCQCMYVGNEAAYQRLRQAVKGRQMIEDILTTSNQPLENIDMDHNDPLNAEGRL